MGFVADALTSISDAIGLKEPLDDLNDSVRDATGIDLGDTLAIGGAVATGAGLMGVGPLAGLGSAGTASQGAMLADQTAAFGAAGTNLTAEALASNAAASSAINAGIMADYVGAAGAAAGALDGIAGHTADSSVFSTGGGAVSGNYDPLLDLEVPMTQEEMLAAQTAEFGPEGALWTQEAGLAGQMPVGTEQAAMLAEQTAEFGLPGSTLTAEAASGTWTAAPWYADLDVSAGDIVKKVGQSWLQGWLGQQAAEQQNATNLKALEAAKTPWGPQAAAAIEAFNRSDAAYSDYMNNAKYYTDPDTGNPYAKTSGILNNMFSAYENKQPPQLVPTHVNGFATLGVI